MNKRWQVRQKANDEEVKRLVAELNIPPVLSNLLINRGIDNYEDARYFFRPDERHLHDPFLMAGMEQAV
ncbi:MAG: single-stranded-DNA-specific exonuclease RecJ, partial [Chitinophagaceae bacterium]